MPKSEARYFGFGKIGELAERAKWNQADAEEAARELKNAGAFKLYSGCTGNLEDKAIVYMENRFKDNVVGVASFLAQFIP